ncbi:MAG TPA: histidine kinase dimerization/phospho-acceptor domain-containing protein [bacterium]|nr:histidine kinase dimerization/phospho-acceptor domain-containing protein [bacterium]HPO07902.1 histidine kinase dimerization/phospho-acceptor domain-containing protein [bacterium]HQO34361.1 histidine kinase dimerization/phospho-acceptor domain-containing protein [bacterium]HQP98355.1 histidine kinase dimerization/phospho-acceptor domain-containing protein [bacterium]
MADEQVPENRPDIQLVSLLLHDLETPLAVVKRFLDRVDEGKHDPDNPRHKKLLDSSQLAIQRATRILEDLLDQARSWETGLKVDLQPKDISEIVIRCLRVVEPLTEDKSLQTRVHVAESVPNRIPCDEALIERVIDNFLVNAIRSAPLNAVIDIRILSRDDFVRLEVVNPLDLVLSVDLDEVFDIHRQVELRRLRGQCGSGLGLRFSRMAIEAHHGRIGAMRSDQSEAVFWFELPRL